MKSLKNNLFIEYLFGEDNTYCDIRVFEAQQKKIHIYENCNNLEFTNHMKLFIEADNISMMKILYSKCNRECDVTKTSINFVERFRLKSWIRESYNRMFETTFQIKMIFGIMQMRFCI